MNIEVSKIAPPFTLSFGEEDGLFSAIIWPIELGDIPYSAGITASVVSQGFLLQGLIGEPAIAFLGVSDEVLNDLAESNITLLIPIDEDYDSRKISFLKLSNHCEIDYSKAVEIQSV